MDMEKCVLLCPLTENATLGLKKGKAEQILSLACSGALFTVLVIKLEHFILLLCCDVGDIFLDEMPLTAMNKMVLVCPERLFLLPMSEEEVTK